MLKSRHGANATRCKYNFAEGQQIRGVCVINYNKAVFLFPPCTFCDSMFSERFVLQHQYSAHR